MTFQSQLENLKTKSLLESLGDGFSRIGMHDLWREFAKLETKVGKFKNRRWLFEWDEDDTLEEASLTLAGSWVNLRRMFFLESGFIKLKDVNFASFPNVSVLKLSRNDASPLELDVSGLQQLKSLELERKEVPVIFVWQRKSTTSVGLVGLGSLSKLGFLRWSNIPSDSPCIDDISRLTSLQVLDLYGGGRLPDVSNLTLLRVACFRDNGAAESIAGLSSKLTNLRHLDLRKCKALQSCSGVGELVALEELNLKACYKLKEVPDLQKLKRLRKLDVGGCQSIRSLPGLGDLVALRELEVSGCVNLAEFPDMCNLTNLQIFELQCCELIKSLPGLNELVRLQSLKTWGCENLTTLPNMQKLTNLQTLQLTPHYPLQSAAGLSDLVSLRYLNIGFDELQDWPDLRQLTKLETLFIAGWQAEGFSSIGDFVLLETLYVHKCKGVRSLPDLQKLKRLRACVRCRISRS
jgi:Leucine-rich repeat (LRR) protein